MNMSQEIKEDLLPKLRARYTKRGREAKSRMLDELCEDYGYERKYAIKLLGDRLPRPSGRPKPGPCPEYTAIESVIRAIWLAAEQPCGKRLAPALKTWLPHYERHHEKLSAKQRRQLRSISPATVDRLLASARAQHRPRGRCGTKPGSLLKIQIPIRTGTWDISQPGYLEADTVAHCGGSLAGDFIWSVTYTDIFSAWTEGRAVWNKGAHGVLSATQDAEESLPFGILGFDSDNGGEFLNYHLLEYFTQRPKAVQFTRSRPYHKDDNAHVEQKNWMWPRQLLGYDRLENPQLVAPICKLFKEAWGPLHNFFVPSQKLQSKWREGSHWRKRYEPAATAYQRLMKPGVLARGARRELRDEYESLDPFVLAQEVEKQLKGILGRQKEPKK
jgi:hypothetical protein